MQTSWFQHLNPSWSFWDHVGEMSKLTERLKDYLFDFKMAIISQLTLQKILYIFIIYQLMVSKVLILI